MTSFKGKSVVITGGSNGIGLETCKQLLARETANIAIIDIQDNLEEITSLRNKYPSQSIIFVKVDVSNKAGVESAYDQIAKSFGQIDIVINVAGIFNDLDVHRTITVNLGGIINSTFAAMHHMSKENGGNGGIIANMSSVVGLDPMFLIPVYSSTKHAIVGFTRCLSNEYYKQRTGINFLVLCPGATITQMFTNFTEKILYPDLGDESYRLLDRLGKQSAADVSRCILQALEQEKNGAVVIIEERKLHPIKMTRYWDNIEKAAAAE